MSCVAFSASSQNRSSSHEELLRAGSFDVRRRLDHRPERRCRGLVGAANVGARVLAVKGA